MANVASPLTYLNNREYGLLPDFKSEFFKSRLNVAKNLYRRDLVCHFGCVNAIEFSSNGELLISGIYFLSFSIVIAVSPSLIYNVPIY